MYGVSCLPAGLESARRLLVSDLPRRRIRLAWRLDCCVCRLDVKISARDRFKAYCPAEVVWRDGQKEARALSDAATCNFPLSCYPCRKRRGRRSRKRKTKRAKLLEVANPQRSRVTYTGPHRRKESEDPYRLYRDNRSEPMDSGDFSLPHAPLLAAPDSQFLSPASIASLSLCLPASPSSKPDYVTHLVSLQRGAPSGQLLALTSGGHCHLVDKRTLQRTDTWEVIKDGSSAAAKDGFCSIKLTNAAKMDDGSFWGVTDRTGTCTIFDDRSGAQTRKQSVTIDTPTNSALLSLAFSPPGANGFSAAPLVALGHELQSLDAPIYLYDLRNPAAPVLTYDQSHSDDVTFLDLSAFPLLLSGSTDGLMTVFDTTKGSDEDEAVLSAVNTGSSIARGAWQVGPPQDWRIGLFARAQESQWQVDLQGTLGKVWAASDMQTVGVWDAGSVSLFDKISSFFIFR